jgi:hypothetical protein
MPTGTTIQQFIDDLKEGKSSIARSLDDLFGTKQALRKLRDHPNLGDLRNPGALNDPLPGWAEDELRGQGWSGPHPQVVGNAEIAHINKWDDLQKDELRAKLADSIDNLLPLEFYWELTGKPERIDVPQLGFTGNVTFHSPRGKIRSLTALTGDVTVDV